MSVVTRFFKKRPAVSRASKSAGVLLLLMAAAAQLLFGYYILQNRILVFSTRAEVVAEVVERTGLPDTLVNLYAESLLSADSQLVFAPVGVQVVVRFESLDSALTWGGRNSSLTLEIDGEAYAFRAADEMVVERAVEAGAEVVESSTPPIVVDLYVPPIGWEDSLPATLNNDEPYLGFTVTDAETALLHTQLPAHASFDLVYARKNADTPGTFTNTSRDSRINNQDFGVVVVSDAEGQLLQEADASLRLGAKSVGDRVGLVVFLELLVLAMLLFAIGVYRGGLE
jgi:hypothetical protein